MKPSLRASELDRAFSCPGSITLTRIVDEREGDDGEEGVMLHWMIADRAIRELGALPPDGGLPPPNVSKGYKLPNNSLWIVDWAIYHIRETVPDDWALLVEVEMTHDFDRWRNTGHADIIAINAEATKMIGIDWKTGRDPVDPADNNWQVADYMALAKCEWPSLEEITFQIAQPRLVEENGLERVSTVTVNDGLSLIAAIDKAACASLDRPLFLKTGKQCRWCVGCSCPAIQAEQELMEIELTPDALKEIKNKPDDPVLGKFVATGRRLAKALDDAEALLHKRLDETPSITTSDGQVITRKIQRGAYDVPDPLKFFAAVKELLPSEASQAKVMTPSVTRIKDEIAQVMNIPKTGKASVTAENVFDAKLRPLVEQGERKILVIT